MRPRVFPAEDRRLLRARQGHRRCFNEAAGIPRGRRGRLPRSTPVALGFNEAAGIPRGRRRQVPRLPLGSGAASMRPRVFPAEDLVVSEAAPRRHVASMRPRVFPAEDAEEGAAEEGAAEASMRPRVFPAEDVDRAEGRGAATQLQ